MKYTFETGYVIFQEKINTLFNVLKKPLRLGIACSGGSDSILLLHYSIEYKKNNPEKIDFLLLVHIIDGHQLVESSLLVTQKQAHDLVLNLAGELQIQSVIYNNSDVSLFAKKISIEMLCHQIRKEFFNRAKAEYQLDRILTGHTLTDQLEHFFIGIIRRASLQRISGMKEDSGFYQRPLLFMKKQNTEEILHCHNKEHVADPCNNNMHYLRNKLRNNCLPILPLIDNRFEESIINIMQRIYEQEDFINELVKKELQQNHIYRISYFVELNKVLACKIIEKILYQLSYKQLISIAICFEIFRFLHTKEGGQHEVRGIIITKKNKQWSINLKK